MLPFFLMKGILMVSQMCKLITVCACVAVMGRASAHDHQGVFFHQELLITHQEERDLELYAARDGSPGVIDFFDYTVTKRGRAHLHALFKHPAVDYQRVCQRQAHIKYLVDHEEFCENMSKLLRVIANAEGVLYGAATDIEQKIVASFYYDVPSFNQYDMLLTTRYYAGTALLAMPTIEHLVFHFLLSEKLKTALGLECACGGHDHTHNHEGAQAVYGLYTCVHMGFHIMGVIELIKQIRDRNGYLALMKERLQSLYTVLDALEDFSDSIYEHQTIYTYYQDFDDMPLLLDLSEKFSLMRQDIADLMYSWMPSCGKVLRLYTQALDLKEQVEKLLDCAGRVEADVSCAQSYIQLKKDNLPCSFVHFINQEHPVLTVNNAWHPLIGYYPKSSSTINFGAQWSGALITGDNMTGKSTLLKTCGVAVVVGLATGFVLADNVCMTPPVALCTSFCLDDMLTQGLSKYAAELQRAESIQKIIETVHAPIVVLVDELFVATRAEKGKKALTEFLDMIFTQSHVIGCVATHYHDVACHVCESYAAIAPVFAVCNDGVYTYTYGNIIPPIRKACCAEQL